MRNDKHFKTLQRRGKRFAKSAVCVGLAGCMLMGGNSLIAHAATLDDVFDAEQYADDYADLKAAFGYDRAALLNHYKTYGILEGRHVSGLIDIAKYREAYPDLYAAFGDDWDAYVDHFLTFGILEGRDSGTDFDVLAYAERYADIKEVLGDDFLAIYQHYQTVGKTEGRIATTTVATPAPSTSVSSSGSTSTSSGAGSSGNTGTPGSGSDSGNESTPGTGSTPEDEDTPGTGNTPEGEDTSGSGNQGGAHVDRFPLYDGRYVIKEYNDSGKLFRSTSYTADDKITEIYEYDENERQIKFVNNDDNGNLIHWDDEYVYSDAGNNIQFTRHEPDGSWTVRKFTDATPHRQTEATFYNKNGQITCIENYGENGGPMVWQRNNAYDEDGELEYYIIYDCDDSGKQTGYTKYDPDGKVLEQRSY